jgi:hypothetical protein
MSDRHTAKQTTPRKASSSLELRTGNCDLLGMIYNAAHHIDFLYVCCLILASLFGAFANQYVAEHEAFRNEEPGTAKTMRKCLFQLNRISN